MTYQNKLVSFCYIHASPPLSFMGGIGAMGFVGRGT